MPRPAFYRKFKCIEDRSWVEEGPQFPNGGIKKGEIYHGEVVCVARYHAGERSRQPRVLIVEKPTNTAIVDGWSLDMFTEVFDQ